MKKIVTVVRFDLAKRESVVEDSRMLSPLDLAALPKNVTALRTLLLSREQALHAQREQGADPIRYEAGVRGTRGARREWPEQANGAPWIELRADEARGPAGSQTHRKVPEFLHVNAR